jgi:hypothetical protein
MLKNFTMQSKFFYPVAFIVLAAIVLMVLFGGISTNRQSQNQSIPQDGEIAQPEAFPPGTFPSGIEPIDLSIDGADAPEGTVRLSWKDSQLKNVFYLVVYDAEDFSTNPAGSLVWAISSIKGSGVLPADGVVTDENITGFIPSGEPISGNLTVGRKYYAQVSGFTEDGDIAVVNKHFTFTNLCLPPDCLPAGDAPEGHK